MSNVVTAPFRREHLGEMVKLWKQTNGQKGWPAYI